MCVFEIFEIMEKAKVRVAPAHPDVDTAALLIHSLNDVQGRIRLISARVIQEKLTQENLAKETEGIKSEIAYLQRSEKEAVHALNMRAADAQRADDEHAMFLRLVECSKKDTPLLVALNEAEMRTFQQTAQEWIDKTAANERYPPSLFEALQIQETSEEIVELKAKMNDVKAQIAASNDRIARLSASIQKCTADRNSMNDPCLAAEYQQVRAECDALRNLIETEQAEHHVLLATMREAPDGKSNPNVQLQSLQQWVSSCQSRVALETDTLESLRQTERTGLCLNCQPRAAV